MAFLPPDLSVLAYANKFTLWHYTTTDADITIDDYFRKAADMLRVNDLITANVDTHGAPFTKFYIVTTNTGRRVSITAYA